jgi:hypothetical protein
MRAARSSKPPASVTAVRVPCNECATLVNQRWRRSKILCRVRYLLPGLGSLVFCNATLRFVTATDGDMTIQDQKKPYPEITSNEFDRRVRRKCSTPVSSLFEPLSLREWKAAIAPGSETIHTSTMTLKSAASLAMIGMLLLTILLTADFIRTVSGVLSDLV